MLILLMMPLLSWVGSNGGVPICCWGMKHCPMAAMGGGGMSGPPMAGCSHRPQCHMSCMMHLILPAPAVPVYPAGMMARIPRPTPVAAQSAELDVSPLPAHAPPIDHPPLA